MTSVPPLLRDLWSSSLATVLAICALGGSGSGLGYRIVEASEGSLLSTGGCCALGVAIVNSCGLALLDLVFARIGIGGGAGGGGGGG